MHLCEQPTPRLPNSRDGINTTSLMNTGEGHRSSAGARGSTRGQDPLIRLPDHGVHFRERDDA